MQLHPLTISYVLKNMCNFSFCYYEKTYCTYTVLLFLAHADHCLHSPPNSSNSARQSQTHQIFQLAARPAVWRTAHRAWCSGSLLFSRHTAGYHCRRVAASDGYLAHTVQHHGEFSVCSLDVSLYGVMMSWGFYEFDEYGMLHTVEHFK